MEMQKVVFPPSAEITRAEVAYLKPPEAPMAVLALGPGIDGDGGKQLQQPAWQAFARENNLGLMGLDFASPDDALQHGKGYYYASQGSGDLLVRAISKVYGKDLPILLYGFSAGAQFVSRFAEWKPEQIMGWCAYAGGWWDKPVKSDKMPPGIIACGKLDGERYGAALIYFRQGRSAGKPWLWISLPDTGHKPSAQLEEFARAYFKALLETGKKAEKNQGVWVDTEQETTYADAKEIDQPGLAAWLPNEQVFLLWKNLHSP
jgi:hypothetical protein